MSFKIVYRPKVNYTIWSLRRLSKPPAPGGGGGGGGGGGQASQGLRELR